MLKHKYLLLALLVSSSFLSNAQIDFTLVDKSNTWLKIGINTALPISSFGESHKFGLGIDASIQFLETKASGIGLKAGYINYFAKGSDEDVGVLPLAIMMRFYPESQGWFYGLELGYAFVSGLSGTSGGYFGRPQLGLHFDYWNIYGYYDRVIIEESGISDLQAIGIGLTYNVRFK